MQRLLDILGFLRFVVRRWSEDRCAQVAGSLTYTTLLALVPLFAVVVATLSALPIFDPMMAQLKVFLLLNLVPEIAGRIITVYMEEFTVNAGRLTVVGLAFLGTMAFTMLLTVDRSLNAIWRVRRGRPWWVSAIAYLILLLVGPLLVAFSVSVTTYLATLSAGVTAGLPAPAKPLLLRLAPMAVSVGTFFLVYRLVPNRHVPWRHALAGAVIAALLFEAMKDAFAFYLLSVPTLSLVYGAFSAIPVFLIWVYASWVVVLLGAEVTASAVYWRGARWRHIPTPGTRFRDALIIGRHLMRAQGEPLSFERLRREVELPAEDLEDALTNLVDEGVLRRTRPAGFALARAPEEVTLGDFYRAAVSQGAGITPQEWSDYVPELARVATELEAQLRRPLTDLEVSNSGR